MMDIIQAIETRHSVRSFENKPIEQDIRVALEKETDAINEESGLSFQLVFDEPKAFGSSILARYGNFEGVTNYIVCVGPKSEHLDEKVGYFGEKLVLKAQQLGLNTCWVGLTYSKRKSQVRIGKDEKLVCVIAMGYGKTQGRPRKTKTIEQLCSCEGTMPPWFEVGMCAAQLAPTAINQQKFIIELYDDNVVSARSLGGPYSNLDLGIVRCHFEIAANEVSRNWKWSDWEPCG